MGISQYKVNYVQHLLNWWTAWERGYSTWHHFQLQSGFEGLLALLCRKCAFNTLEAFSQMKFSMYLLLWLGTTETLSLSAWSGWKLSEIPVTTNSNKKWDQSCWTKVNFSRLKYACSIICFRTKENTQLCNLLSEKYLGKCFSFDLIASPL